MEQDEQVQGADPLADQRSKRPHGTVHLSVALEARPSVSYAAQQNQVPAVLALEVANRGAKDLTGLVVRLSGDPAFVDPWRGEISRLGSGERARFVGPFGALLPSYLSQLGESQSAIWRVEVHTAEGELLQSFTQPVRLSAFDHWDGLDSLGELLAAFVAPNSPQVNQWLHQVAARLETGGMRLTGYASGFSGPAEETARAAFEVLQAAGLSYASPPASFEQSGQKVRAPERMAKEKLGTCLDLALAAAAIVEQAGLHPLVVLVDRHAFAGVWLEELTFAAPITEDGAALENRVALKQVVLFDPTLATDPSATFEAAVAAAANHLARERASPGHFRGVLDVARARRGGVRPLPTPSVGTAPSVVPAAPLGPSAASRALGGDERDLAASAAPVPAAAEAAGAGLPVHSAQSDGSKPRAEREPLPQRIERWRRKLLDLSLRNRLLHFRESASTLALVDVPLAELETRLARGEALVCVHRPSELDPNGSRNLEQPQRLELAQRELASQRLLLHASEEELGTRLLEIFRRARTAREEGGSSGLFLALGFLEWWEGDRERRAPLVLIPVALERQGAGHRFALVRANEEPRFNSTLLEMLALEHGITLSGVEPLPEDGDQVDVPRVLARVREAILHVPRWRVLENAALSFFTFAKYLLWQDLKQLAGDLQQSPVAAHLIDARGGALDPDFHVFEAGLAQLDQRVRVDTLACPLSADASQLSAVLAAAQGRSFVLEGPPGTGKSQTIANAIAHLLYQGRTVLFVAEKIAALSVVHGRLERLGLGRFCLELHSNKTKKADVARALGEALDARPLADPLDFARNAARLQAERDALTAYVQALHEPGPAGLSAFQAVGRLCADRGWEHVRLPEPWGVDLSAWDREQLDAALQTARAASHAARAVWPLEGNGLTGVGLEDGDRVEFERRARAEAAATEEVLTLARAARGPGDGDLDLCSAEELERQAAHWGALGELAANSPEDREVLARLCAAASADRDGAWRSSLARWFSDSETLAKLDGSIRGIYPAGLQEIDLEDLTQRVQAAKNSFGPIRWWHARRPRSVLMARLGPNANRAKERQVDALAKVLADEQERRGIQSRLAADRGAMEARLGPIGAELAQGQGGPWQRVMRLWAQLEPHLGRLGVSSERLGAALLGEASEGIGAKASRAAEALKSHRVRTRVLAGDWRLDESHPARDVGGPAHLSRLLDALRGAASASASLRPFGLWRRRRRELAELGLLPLALAMERGELHPDALESTLEQCYARALWERMRAERPALGRFLRPEHEEHIARFRELDERIGDDQRERVLAAVSARAPRASAAVEGSELGVLRREAGKKTRHMALRRLLSETGRTVQRLKPCFLMSPTSVAQYLDPEGLRFDVVIFDEASQIPVWDAVGAIARGRQTIVVGDGKQLPPTSFFERLASEDEGAELEDAVPEDLESVLDESVASGLPRLSLRWHYRSRHESLIHFSNRRYYEGKLFTFPSAVHEREGLGVRFVHVGGVYDRAGSRTNRAEAEAVVAEVNRRLDDPRWREFSLGIVAFSSAQARLVEDLLDQLRRERADLERYFVSGPDRPEPVFVKNLESVQGDERDVVLFTVGYAPDESGRMTMNFGPLNQQGGERRLNVAITRARRELLVFSSITAAQVDSSRTRAQGVLDLKAFLDFAERGPTALVEEARTTGEDSFESPFEEAVARGLRSRGLDVVSQVGCGSYRIDLGLLDPEEPGRYLLGVECDGRHYHAAQSARDRDKLRARVLEGLGWRLVRIWSTDFFEQPEQELDRVVLAFETELSKARAERQAVEGRARDVYASAPAPSVAVKAPSGPVSGLAAEPLVAEDEATPDEVSETDLEEQPRVREVASAFGDSEPTGSSEGKFVAWKPRRAPVARESFHEESAASKLMAALSDLVAQEGPILLDVALARLVRASGWERTTQKLLGRLEPLVARASLSTTREPDGALLLWPPGAQPQGTPFYREPGPDPKDRRGPEEIPLFEYQGALLFLLKESGACPRDSLFAAARARLGFAATGSRVRERLDAALEHLLRDGWAQESEDGRVVAVDRA